MRNRCVLAILILLGTTGCAVTSKVMIDDQGRQVRCGSFGFGVIGTAVAVGTYMECVKNQKALGFVDLEDYEKTEPPKLEQRPGITPPKITRPFWETGYAWTYQLGGKRTGTLRQEVIGKDLVNGLTGYVLKSGEDKLLLSEELNTIQYREKESITSTHTPPLQNYEWPLEVGKTWQAKGVMETRTGKLDTSKKVEVKGYGIVRVPAGEFEAFYLLGTSDVGSRISEIWYAPRVRQHVKLVNYTNEGRITSELVSFSFAPASAPLPTPPSQPVSPAVSMPAPSLPPPVQEALRSPTSSPPASSPSGPWLGVPLGPADQQALDRVGIRQGRGAVVLPFTRNPSLPPIDLDPGDVVLAIDGVEVEGPGHISALLAGRSPGTTVQVRTFRCQYHRQVEQAMVIFHARP